MKVIETCNTKFINNSIMSSLVLLTSIILLILFAVSAVTCPILASPDRKTKPVGPNNTFEGNAANRRVEFEKTKF